MRIVHSRERSLILRHREGDRDAFADLVEEYRAPVYSYLVRCGVHPGDRDDLFQDVFIRVHRAAHSYDEDRPLHPWIFTIVANAVRSHLRKRRVRELVHADPPDPDVPAAEPVHPGPSGERQAAARERLGLLEKEIGKLPAPQREALLLATVEKLPLKDVADALKTPVNTVKTHLRRARLKLAAALDRHDAGGLP